MRIHRRRGSRTGTCSWPTAAAAICFLLTVSLRQRHPLAEAFVGYPPPLRAGPVTTSRVPGKSPHDSSSGGSGRKFRNFDDDDDNEIGSHNDDDRATSSRNLRLSQLVRTLHGRNLRLSQLVKTLRGRARKRLDDGMVDLYGAYGSSKIPDPHVQLYLERRRRLLRKEAEGKKAKKAAATVPVSTVEELRRAVLDDGIELRNVELRHQHRPPAATTAANSSASNSSAFTVEDGAGSTTMSHEVLDLIARRFESNSKPSARHPTDSARLALSIEGGGMRGAVSAGMAAAIACLGLCDAFDVIYGSSAGSVVGAYFVSRQMCIDVYTDVLPRAKGTFVSKGRIATGLAKNLADVLLSKTPVKPINQTVPLVPPRAMTTPGMNISFVLDGIMCPQFGLRPLDLDAFRANDAHQPLRIVASTVRVGEMETICFGSADQDFFDEIDDETGLVTEFATTSADGKRHGLFACLEASMSVPGAAGPPIPLVRSRDAHDNNDNDNNTVSSCFDAFCYEPIPYRSAVQEGATHVLVLRSRPDGFDIKTKPGVYERAVAPLYFRAHGHGQVAEYFERGGQQYVYAEDCLALDEAKQRRSSSSGERGGVPVPPPQILHGAPEEQRVRTQRLRNRAEWKRAHLLPVVLPRETPELASLEQGEDEVLAAVRGGFAAAYDLLAPAVGLEIEGLTGKRAAELVFPKKLTSTDAETVLREPREVRGEPIARRHDVDGVETEGRSTVRRRKRFRRWMRKDERTTGGTERPPRDEGPPQDDSPPQDDTNAAGYAPCPKRDATTLLALLPGIQSGALAPLTEGLLHHKHS